MKTGLKYTIFKTDWGFFGLLANDKGLLRTVLPTKNYKTTKKYLLVGMFQPAKEDKALYSELQRTVRNYYKGCYVNFKKLPLSISHSRFGDFALKVVKVCKGVPFGKTITYSQLAKKAGFPMAARAVGNILAKNPLPLIIPCHRVIRADGKIGNFSAPGVRRGRTASQRGSKMKKKMLKHEKLIAIRRR